MRATVCLAASRISPTELISFIQRELKIDARLVRIEDLEDLLLIGRGVGLDVLRP